MSISKFIVVIELFSFNKIYSAELFDNFYLKKLIESLLFIGSLSKCKDNFLENGLYRKCDIKPDSDSLYLYFHGNAEYIRNIGISNVYDCISKNKNISSVFYEYPGYFNTFGKYKDATIENFIDYSKEIANDIISFKKKNIYIVAWSLGVWVALMVLNNLAKYIISENIKVKVVLVNGFYDLYRFLDEFGGILKNNNSGILKNNNIISILYNSSVRILSKLFISDQINNMLSNMRLIKKIKNISDIKYVTLSSCTHYDWFYTSEDIKIISDFLLKNISDKNIEILMASARADKITGTGMFKIYKEICKK